MFTKLINGAYSAISSVKFDTLMWIICGTFAGIFFVTLIATVFTRKIGMANKRPFLCLVNAYTAVTLAAVSTVNGFPQSVLAAAAFWCVAYIAYGVLCAFTKPQPPVEKQIAISALPAALPASVQARKARVDVPAAKSTVRLDHAVTVTDNLLRKNLGKGDRQELEKLKNTLVVLQMKGTLTPAESDILTDNFNALLKLMAKYNI